VARAGAASSVAAGARAILAAVGGATPRY
jgi:hypothetical protein